MLHDFQLYNHKLFAEIWGKFLSEYASKWPKMGENHQKTRHFTNPDVVSNPWGLSFCAMIMNVFSCCSRNFQLKLKDGKAPSFVPVLPAESNWSWWSVFQHDLDIIGMSREKNVKKEMDIKHLDFKCPFSVFVNFLLHCLFSSISYKKCQNLIFLETFLEGK